MKWTTAINVQWITIGVVKTDQESYISLTDMIRAKDWDFFISDRLRNRNTIEFLSIWEEVNNPKFNCGESAIIKSNVWLNNYKISVKDRVKKTSAIGLFAKTGRYGWTYAHKDIAFEFGMRISPKFKVYFIKEFQRLKQQDLSVDRYGNKALDRDVKRFLTKMNYRIHTDAIKENLIPKTLSQDEINFVYADEADILNKSLFGITAKEWRESAHWKDGNMRDYATVEQLIILANLESINAQFITMWMKQSERLQLLNQTAITQIKSLVENTNKYQWLVNNKII